MADTSDRSADMGSNRVNVLIDVRAHPVIAHRGNSAYAPENTLPSFDQAVALGADALEFDVRLTRDGVPVVIHDATLERTTSGNGLVADISHVELRGLDAGARFTIDDGRSYPYRGRGLMVPALEEVLSHYEGMPLLIEVKVAEAVEPTRQLLQQCGAMARTLVDSAAHAAVAPFRGRNDAIATGASMKEVAALLRRAWLPRSPRALPYEALCIPRWYHGLPIPVIQLAKTARRAGAVTHVWTVNDPSVARRLWRRGVQGVITDDPGAMLRARELLLASGDASG